MTSIVTVRRGAESHLLVDPSTVVDALEVTGAEEIKEIERLVSAMSQQVEDETNRVFAREQVTEKLGLDLVDAGDLGDRDGTSFRLMLNRMPVLMVQAIRFDGSAIDLSDVQLEDSEAGFLFSAGGFGATNIEIQQLERVRTPYLDPLWEVDYSAGFVLPSFPAIEETFTSVDVDAAANQFTITGHDLADGDTVRFSTDGTLPAGLSKHINYILRDGADDTFKVAALPNGAVVDVTDGGTGTHTVTRQVTMPASLQNDLVRMVTSQFRSRKRDPSIKSERLGDHAITYSDAFEIPASVRSSLSRWRNLV
ncbi:hypothetical protein LCGC14_1567870 [marine sediment metagenome]|uniref:Uncharacterized protein n=1 Tax=marine sediment metagenome TaxID=412755 RepID=A0A0F9LL47_9ZZZZ